MTGVQTCALPICTFALVIALMATPGGQTFLGLSGAVWDDIVNFFRSLVGLAPNSPTV